MSQVRKFEIKPYDGKATMLPRDAELLHVGTQTSDGVEAVYVWALVDIDAELVERRIGTVGTGHNLPEGVTREQYIGTARFASAPLVFHLFDLGEASDA